MPICCVQHYTKTESGPQFEGLFVTPDHPFYIKDVGWRTAIEVASSEELISYDGKIIGSYDCYTLWETPEEAVAYGQSTIFDMGPLVDFSSGQGKVSEEFHPDSAMGGMSSLWCQKVYNLEVEDFHTYYVGELGVWVHNMCCIKT